MSDSWVPSDSVSPEGGKKSIALFPDLWLQFVIACTTGRYEGLENEINNRTVTLRHLYIYENCCLPPLVESSFFGSPTAGSVPLSPTRSKKRRLVCEKIPGSADGQTRLTFS